MLFRSAMRDRIERAARRPGVLLLDYAALAEVTMPDGTHVVVLDPPSSPAQAQWLRFHGADRHVHLVWTDHEVAFAQFVAADRWDLRPLAEQVWRNLAAQGSWRWDTACEQALLGSEAAMRLPDAVADTLIALSELGFLRIDRQHLVVLDPPERRRLEDAPRVIAAQAQLLAAGEYLARAGTLELFAAEYQAVVESVR